MAITQATPVSMNYDDPLKSARDAYLGEGNSDGTSSDSLESDEPTITPWTPQEETIEENKNVPESEVSDTTKIDVLSTPDNTDIETLYVKDAKGKKQKLEVSYTDKQRIKEAFLKAAGMRKFQLERDDERKSKAEFQKKYEELSGDFGKLEQIFKEQGARGVFERLGGNGSFEKAVEDELKRREHFASLSPDERTQITIQEKEKAYRAEKDDLQKKYDAMLNKINEEQEKVAVRSLESRLTPAFEKHRFKGKLGDDVAEQELDEAIWTKVMNRLGEYPDDVDLTQAIVDKEFRNVSSIYKRVLDKQTDSKLQQAVSKQKDNAAQKAQVMVKKGMSANSIEQSVANDVKNSNWSSLLQKAFSGQLK